MVMKYSELNDKDRWAAIRAGVKAGYKSIDDIEKAYNEYAIGGDILGNIRNGSKVDTTECAAWSNGLLRDNGYLIYGNAWNLGNVDKVFDGYDTLERPSKYDINSVMKYNHDASDRIYREFDSKTLDPKKNYVVNMYYNGSPQQERAYNEGRNTGTHTGTLTYDDKAKRWMVTHNVHGTIHQEPFVQLQSGKNKYGVTAIYSPREDNLGNRIKGFFGFANGGDISHKFDGEEFSGMTDQDVYLKRLKEQQDQKLNLTPDFTNQMWNSKAGLEARKNSGDFLTQEAARREEERQKQFQQSADKKEIERLRMLAKDGTIKNKDLLAAINNPNSTNEDILNAYHNSLKQDAARDYSQYDSGIAKIAAAWGVSPEKLKNLDTASSMGEITPGLTGKFIAAGNIGGNIGAALLHPGQGNLKDAMSSAVYLLPGAGVVKSAKMAKAGNPWTWKNITGIGRGIYGLGDAANGVTSGIDEAMAEMNTPGNLTSQFVEQETTQQYNPYQQMINNSIANRSKAIQADNAARAAAQQPKVQTTAPTTTTTQPVPKLTPEQLARRNSMMKQQTTTQPVAQTQQQVTQQKPTKMQGFMNNLGQASPYLADFLGWTFR